MIHSIIFMLTFNYIKIIHMFILFDNMYMFILNKTLCNYCCVIYYKLYMYMYIYINMCV